MHQALIRGGLRANEGAGQLPPWSSLCRGAVLRRGSALRLKLTPSLITRLITSKTRPGAQCATGWAARWCAGTAALGLGWSSAGLAPPGQLLRYYHIAHSSPVAACGFIRKKKHSILLLQSSGRSVLLTSSTGRGTESRAGPNPNRFSHAQGYATKLCSCTTERVCDTVACNPGRSASRALLRWRCKRNQERSIELPCHSQVSQLIDTSSTGAQLELRCILQALISLCVPMQEKAFYHSLIKSKSEVWVIDRPA